MITIDWVTPIANAMTSMSASLAALIVSTFNTLFVDSTVPLSPVPTGLALFLLSMMGIGIAFAIVNKVFGLLRRKARA